MFYLIKKDTRAVVQAWAEVPGRIHIPGGGDVVFGATAPMDVGPDHVLRRATVTGFEPFDPTIEVRTGPVNTVAPDFDVTETWTVRAKTQAELDVEQRSQDTARLREAGKDMALVLTELVTWLVTNTAMQASDFSPDVRQAYQDLKVIADRVK